MNRRRFLVAAVGSLLGVGAAASARSSLAAASVVRSLDVYNAARAFPGRRRFATVSPRSVGARARAVLRVDSARPVDATLEVVSRNGVGAKLIGEQPAPLHRGMNEIEWAPPPSTRPGSYMLRLRDRSVERAPTLGSVVVSVLDVEAAFTERSVVAGGTATLAVTTDAPWLRMTLLLCGKESGPTNSNYEMRGVEAAAPQRIDTSRSRGRPINVPVVLPPMGSGLYAARLEGPSGRIGFAPVVARPPAPTQRIAVVLPTTTWQAYNYTDSNGDGFGDTWYSLWSQRRIDLRRSHLRNGVPERYRSYDVQFQRWLGIRGHQVDTYADEDIDRFRDAQTLRAAYDLIVFPGHTEYVTWRTFDLVQGYRDLGGRLLFLSANNFFREVKRSGHHVRLIGEFRRRGRAEAQLLGCQYLANDSGERQQPMVVAGVDAAPWAFAGTGLGNGSSFGRYGIEIDATTPESPPGTQVLARIPDLFGPGRSAEMTYYETAAGARVFSAGVLNFGGTVLLWPETTRLLDNVWARLTDRSV